MYNPHFINDFFLAFNSTITENYTNISNKESFFKYYKVIKYGQGEIKCIIDKTLTVLLDLITPTVFDNIIILEE